MPKLLVEFLDEEQEAFALETYLVERGYSSSCIKRMKRRRDLVGKCSRFVKAIVGRRTRNYKNQYKKKGRYSSSGGNKTINNNNNNIAQLEADHHHQEEEDIMMFSSAISASTSAALSFFNSSTDAEDDDEHMKWRRSIQPNIINKKLSPAVSIREDDQAKDEEGSPFHDDMIKGESSNNITCTVVSECSKRKQPTYDHIIDVEEVDNWQFMINMRVLRQKKQLLIDCVRQVIENNINNINHRRRSDDEDKILMGAEELWKIVCENVWVWSQEYETNIVDDQLLRHDGIFMAAASSQIHKDEISIHIGDAIFQDIIIHELQTIIN